MASRVRGSAFNGVKVFSATMLAQRERLGEEVTSWLESNPQLEIVDINVTQSSDEACIAICVFFTERVAESRRRVAGR